MRVSICYSIAHPSEFVNPSRIFLLNPSSLRQAEHQGSQFLFVCLTRLHNTDDFAVVHHRDSVTEVEEFIEFRRDQQHGSGAVACVNQSRVDESRGVNI